MGGDSDLKYNPNASQGDFWGGYMLDFSLYRLLAILPFTGLLGIDQLALRSPFTALLKFLVNLFFYGAWYIYDVIQLIADKQNIAKYGMSTPYGPRGAGYRFFSNITDNNTDEFSKPSVFNGGLFSVFLYLAYVLLIPMNFTGLPAILAGDFTGGITRLFSNVFFLPFLFSMLAIPYEIYRSITLEKTGIPRSWPLSPWFMLMKSHPATNLMSYGEAEKQQKEYDETQDAMVAQGKNPILLELISKGLQKAGIAITAFPPVAAFQTVTAAKGAVQAASDVGQSLSQAIQKRVATDPNSIVDKLLGDTPAAAAESSPMTGGGVLEQRGEIDTMLIGAIAVIALGGFALTAFRNFTLPKRSFDDLPDRSTGQNDTPPQPGTV
jgi:hypothetical protein